MPTKFFVRSIPQFSKVHIDPQTLQPVRRLPMGLVEGTIIDLIPGHIPREDANIMVKNGDIVPFEAFINNEPPLDFDAMASTRYVDVELFESDRTPKIMVNGAELKHAGMVLEVPPIGAKQIQVFMVHPEDSPIAVNDMKLPAQAGYSINLRATGEKLIEIWVPVIAKVSEGAVINLTWTKGIRSLKVTSADGACAYLLRPAPAQQVD